MEIKTTLIQYRHIITLAGLAIGILGILDATKIYEIGFTSWDQYQQYGLLAIMALSAYTYYSIYMVARPKRRIEMPPQQRQTRQPVDELNDELYPSDSELGGK